jgi:carbon storage regulator
MAKEAGMLVLSRKIGETIRVGSEIELVVLSVNRGRVKLGFDGSRDVRIRRGDYVERSRLPETAPAVLALTSCGATTGDSQQPPSAPLRAFRMASGN